MPVGVGKALLYKLGKRPRLGMAQAFEMAHQGDGLVVAEGHSSHALALHGADVTKEVCEGV